MFKRQCILVFFVFLSLTNFLMGQAYTKAGQAFTKDDDIGPIGIISSPPYSYSSLIGTWTNLNQNSGSILKIVISYSVWGLKITPYYATGSTATSYGIIYARVYGTSIGATSGVAFTAEKNYGFEEEIIMGWRSGSYLKVTSFTMFTDDSSRSNYFVSETFRKIS